MPPTRKQPSRVGARKPYSKVVFASLSENQKHYNTCMNKVAKGVAKLEELAVEERFLLSAAFVKAICIQECREKIETELEQECLEILGLLDEHIPKAESGESKVFYYKLKGDLYGFVAEVACGEKRQIVATAAYEAYEKATDFAQTELAPTHIGRLALALNFSVFCYNILNMSDRACLLAKNAIRGLKDVGGDATWIMQQPKEVAKGCTKHQKDAKDGIVKKLKFNNIPVYVYQFDLDYVMRRCSDNWINASHILLVAGLDKKYARTSYLEREVNKGVHEKVQGGYWKYQGTWVPLEKGKRIALEHGVYERLGGILEFQLK